MNARTQITIDHELRRRARAKAEELGISFAEYVRRAISDAVGPPKPKPDISAIFDLIKDGPVTDIARDKDKLIGEALWEDHLRSIGEKPRRVTKVRSRRR